MPPVPDPPSTGAPAELVLRGRRVVTGGAMGPAAVHVSARREGADRVVISVADNGPGIDPSVRDQLFEPYVTTKKGQGGTGLGLAIAWRIVHEHGGALTVDTSPEGTRFDVSIPVSGPPASDNTTTTIERGA